MKKLSNIEESIWSDIHKRSNGETKRKEDDIDRLDLEDLCEYLRSTYKCSNSKNDISISQVGNKIDDVEKNLAVCLFEDTNNYHRFLFYNGYSINTLSFVIDSMDCLFELEQNYTLSNFKNSFGINCIEIFPKDRARTEITNTFFIEVLDFLLNMVDKPLITHVKKINESIWSDIHKRSNGTQTRKEDDINLMDKDELYDYLSKQYICLEPGYGIKSSQSSSSICAYVYKNKFFYVGYDLKAPMIYCPKQEHIEEIGIFDKLKDNYHVDDFKTSFVISPKDGSDPTNEFFIEIINFFIDNIKEPYKLILAKNEKVK